MQMWISSLTAFVIRVCLWCWQRSQNASNQKGQTPMLKLWLAGYAAIVGMVLGLHTCAPALPLTLEEDFTDTGVGCVDDCLDPMED